MSEKRPVAVYLRMSTEHQKYSLENQYATLAAYAEKQGFSIVKTYTDGAKTGVVIKGREALKQLLKDVIEQEPGYGAILVYDVTRWGRFQDSDEAAHYEFVCKQEGIPVHYCAEPFLNDGGPLDALMKALKRMMAGEYSRELGVKVLAGLKHLASLGFKQGGLPGYGLRRMLVSEDGRPKQILAPGERKSLARDRVILVPGPVEEVQSVRDIYRMFVEEKQTVYAIARELNRRKTKYIADSQWDYLAVYNVLSHAKYTGCNVFGRTSQRLGTASVRMPEAEWVRTPGAFTGLVDEVTFQQAQHLLKSRTTNKSDEDLLAALCSLLARKGRLSLRLIAQEPEMPSPAAYRGRFGSLRRAYELIGYGKPDDFGPVDLRCRTQALRNELIGKLHSMFPDEVSIERRGGRWRPLLRLKDGPTVNVVISRSIKTKRKGLTWQIDPIAHERQLVTLLALLDADNGIVQEMLLFPYMERQKRFYVTRNNEWLKAGLLLQSPSEFLDTVKTVCWV